MMRVVETEFGDVAPHRVTRLSDIVGRGPEGREDTRLVVVEEALAQDLIDRLETYRQAARPARLVLAYHDRAVARRVFGETRAAEADPALLFLPMKASIDVWTSVLKLLLFGEAFLPQELVAAQDEDSAILTVPDDADWQTLTARERQVLAMVSDGKRNKVIAGDLGLSEHTVKLHLHHIFGKIGVRNRTGATRWYLSRVDGAALRPWPAQ